jgi:hypothetical protein
MVERAETFTTFCSLRYQYCEGQQGFALNIVRFFRLLLLCLIYSMAKPQTRALAHAAKGRIIQMDDPDRLTPRLHRSLCRFGALGRFGSRGRHDGNGLD